MFKNLLLLAFSTAISFAFLEFALRVVMPERVSYVPTLLNNESTYVPNQHQRARHLEWDYEVHINADGFRNDKVLKDLPEKSVLALGDSFTEGYGVALEDSYPKRLEKILKGENFSTHVYNAGHYDTALPTYQRVYRNIFKEKLEFDTVVIGLFTGNDILLTPTPPDGRLQLGNEFGDGWRYKFKAFLASSVATYAVLNHVVKTNPTLFHLCKSLGACYRPRPPNIYNPDLIDKAVLHTTSFTTALVQEIQQDGRRVVILLIPTREQIDDAIWAQAAPQFGEGAIDYRYTLNRRLAESLSAAGVNVLDLTSLAHQHQNSSGERLYFKYDGHWTPAGHEFAARQLAAYFAQLIPFSDTETTTSGP